MPVDVFRVCHQTICLFWVVEKMRSKDSGCFNSTAAIANFGENGRAVVGRELNQALTAFTMTSSHFLTLMKRGWTVGLWRGSVASQMQLLNNQAEEKWDR